MPVSEVGAPSNEGWRPPQWEILDPPLSRVIALQSEGQCQCLSYATLLYALLINDILGINII